MTDFDMSPGSTEKVIVTQGQREMDTAKELEHDHETPILLRLLRDKAKPRQH